MRINLSTALREALALFRGERDILMRIGAVAFFLPVFGIGLFLHPIASPDQSATATPAEMIQMLVDVEARVLPLSILATAFAAFGSAALYALFLTGDQTVENGLRAGIRRLPAMFLTIMIVNILCLVGAVAFILPGLYLLGRTYLSGPILIAERCDPFTAIRRSFELTRGHGLMLMAVAIAILIAAFIPSQIFGELRLAAKQGGENPVAVTILVAASAGVGMLASLAGVVIKIAFYRRLLSHNSAT